MLQCRTSDYVTVQYIVQINTNNFRNNRTIDGRPINNKCGKVGHYARRCLTRQQSNCRQISNSLFQSNNRPQLTTNQPSIPALLGPPRPPPPPSIRTFKAATSPDYYQGTMRNFQFARRKNHVDNKTFGMQTTSYHVTIHGLINGVSTSILIDTGAAITAVNADFWK